MAVRINGCKQAFSHTFASIEMGLNCNECGLVRIVDLNDIHMTAPLGLCRLSW